MKKIIITLNFIISIFFTVQFSYSQVTQEWVRTYNGGFSDGITSMVVDNSGNTYVTGYTGTTTGGTDFLTIKYNSEGVEMWVQIYDNPNIINKLKNTDLALAIAIDSSGYVYVTGLSENWSSEEDFDRNYATIKYSPTGVLLWIQRYDHPSLYWPDNIPSSIACDSSGNIYVTGTSDSLYIGSITTIKYNTSGVMQWVRRYGADGYFAKPQMILDDSGCVYVTGTGYGSGYGRDYTIIKYNSSGDELWVRTYNGFSGNDHAKSITLDNNGNVIVTGKSFNGATYECATVKYSSGGELLWSQSFNGHFNDEACYVAADNSGNIYVTGNKESYSGYSSDYVTLKYTESGNFEWVRIYNGAEYNSMDVPVKIFVDNYGDVYVTGHEGTNPPFEPRITTIKYNTAGQEEWIQHFEGSMLNIPKSIIVNNSGDVYVAGVTGILLQGEYWSYDYLTIKYSQILKPIIVKPTPYSKWISGEYDTIKWKGGGWDLVKVKCVINSDTPAEYVMDLGLTVDSMRIWYVPDSILSYRTKIIIENIADTTQFIESGIFRIKPYLLTRVNYDSTYYEFRKDRDQWGYKNSSADMWPASWHEQFNYFSGIDPFTGQPYSVNLISPFGHIPNGSDHVDWISFVNTFTIAACYKNVFQGTYSPTAIRVWRNRLDTWGGSCFGIAIANAIVFRNKEEFLAKYPAYPSFFDPIEVISNDAVKKTINELYTYQYGKEQLAYRRDTALRKTPTQTLNEIKEMLLSENDPVRSLSILSNDNAHPGRHAINVYKVIKSGIPGVFNLSVYDNLYPTSVADIIIDTSANGGKGSWEYTNFVYWGGAKYIDLSEPAITFLNNPSLPRSENSSSPFGFRDDMVTIFNPNDASITIKDAAGNVTGFSNGVLSSDIPNSVPLIVDNGSEGPPYGYELETNNYSVNMNNFGSDKTHADFFNGNNVFTYERSDVIQTQSDELFFDGGIYVKNPDAQIKEIRLGNIVNEASREKVFSISSLELAENDSVNINNSTNEMKLTSTGTAKNYDLELNVASESGLETFSESNVPLPANTSHTFITDWSDIENTDLIVLQDFGNNGTIDDSLTLKVSKTLQLYMLIEGFFDPLKNIMIEDTVTVYIKNYYSPFNTIDSARSVVNGTGIFKFKNPVPGVEYYIVVKHRNSIETWSAAGQSFNSNYMYFDLTKYPSYAYGSNLKLKEYRYCIFSGDVNQDGAVDLNDVLSVYNAALSFSSGYLVNDVNGDNIVDLNDILIAYNNSAGFVAVVRP